MLMMIEGFEVILRSRMLPEAIRVGSFTMFCSPKLLVISSSFLCLLAVLLLMMIAFLYMAVSNRLSEVAHETSAGPWPMHGQGAAHCHGTGLV